MTLAGTRPPTVDEWDKYELHHRARLATKPGLTGMWQVSGRSNITDFEEVVKLDKQYISEWTMGLDMKTTLLIMAAGIGSRFGTGIKQLEPVDASNHIIMDYSIHDAIEAGFNHVVFIIRKDIEKEFKEVIGDRIASICSSHNVTVDYAFQDINDIPGILPEGRTKPWGTGQAVLAAKNEIDTPFIVINADDYYGKEGFKAVHEYLVNGGKSCMAGFVLKNTLSDNGGVTRGICKMDEQNNLTEVVETKNIVKTATGAEADGVAVDVNSLVSMNMWGLTPDFLDVLEEGFKEFFEKEVPSNPLKTEYLIAWIRTFKNSLFFRKLFCLVFFTVMILFRTLLNRNMWMNPLSDVMGGWWIWEKQSDGTVTLTTECFENIALMLPFTFLLMWTAKEKLLKAKGRQICFTSILWYSTKVAFLFSLTIEFLQLFLRLGTFQLSDLCYNTLGGAIGGVLYWMGWKVKK